MAGIGSWMNGLPEMKEVIEQLQTRITPAMVQRRFPGPTSESPIAPFYTVSDDTGQSPDSIFPADLFSG
jgi:hypothetical protein